MSLTPNDTKFLEEQEKYIQSLESKMQTGQIQQVNQDILIEQKEKSMIKEQLDLNDELEMIEHLLKGDILKVNDDGVQKWTAPDDKNMIILSEYGIHLIMNVIKFYINKNTLLSNYDEETILTKMEDFATELADVVFMEYEKVFQYPSDEEVHKALEERIEKRISLRKFTLKLNKQEVNEKEIREEAVKEIEYKVEKELEKIKEQIIKNKLKRFSLLIRAVQDAVHSTYNRAYQGQERRSLRQHMHISETRGINEGSSQPSKLNPLNWIGKK